MLDLEETEELPGASEPVPEMEIVAPASHNEPERLLSDISVSGIARDMKGSILYGIIITITFRGSRSVPEP